VTPCWTTFSHLDDLPSFGQHYRRTRDGSIFFGSQSIYFIFGDLSIW